MQHLHDQIESLKRYRDDSDATKTAYLDGAIAALTWATSPDAYLSLAAMFYMGLDPSKPFNGNIPKLELVRDGDYISAIPAPISTQSNAAHC